MTQKISTEHFMINAEACYFLISLEKFKKLVGLEDEVILVSENTGDSILFSLESGSKAVERYSEYDCFLYSNTTRKNKMINWCIIVYEEPEKIKLVLKEVPCQ